METHKDHIEGNADIHIVTSIPVGTSDVERGDEGVRAHSPDATSPLASIFKQEALQRRSEGIITYPTQGWIWDL